MVEPRFSLIVPAHNEGARIGGSIAGYSDAFSDSEVIVVLNGCTDNTEQAAVLAVGERSNVRFLRVEHAVGKGGAVRAGFLAARAPVIGYVDADGSTPPDEIRRIFELVGDGADAVIGSRWSKGADVIVAQAALRRISSRVFNAIVRVLFGLPYTDTQCGAKAFSSEAIRAISESLETSHFAFDIDVLHGLRRTGKTIREVPTQWRDVSGSRIHLARASRLMLTEIFRLRLRYSLFRYVIPVFDRLWPTRPLRVRNGLAILFLNARDPKHPDAAGPERYLLEVGKRLVARGNRVQWLTAGFAGAPKCDEIDGISITRVGNKYTVYAAIPFEYLRKFRDRFDVVVDTENGLPLFSPLYSLKPKLCLVFHVQKRVFERRLSRPVSGVLRWTVAKFTPWLYSNSRFTVISAEMRTELGDLGVPADLVDVAQSGVDDFSWDATAEVLLDSMFAEISRQHASYVKTGDAWSVVPHVPSVLNRSPAIGPEQRAESLI